MFTHTHLMVSYHKPELLGLCEGVVELVASRRDHSLSHPFGCEGYLDSAQPFALGAPRVLG